MLCAGNVYIHIPVNSACQDIFHQHGMDILDSLFIQGAPFLDTVLYIPECFLVIHLFVDFPQVLAAHTDPVFQYQFCLHQRQGIPLYGV